MRIAVVCLIALAAAAGTARADTAVPGGNLPGALNEWTAAGSPYVVAGDVTVPEGAVLKIDAGVEVRAAGNTDGQMSGANTSRVEFTVAGTLDVEGTAASPVTFDSSLTASGSWYGIVVAATATNVQLKHVEVKNAIYGVSSLQAGAELHTDHLTVTTPSSYGLYLQAGTPTLDSVTVAGAGAYGIVLTGATSATLTNCVVRGAGSRGIDIEVAAGQSTVLASCTIDRNGNYGVYTASASGAQISVTSSIVTNQSIYGLYRADSTAWTVSYTNVWNNANANYAGAIAQTGAGLLSANPLYVSTTDLRLTSNSPSRFGAANGTSDQGALPYDTVATPGLYGTLWVNTSLTAAASPYTVAGDLTVPHGVTLTIEAGATLTFAANADIMGANANTARAELIVRGKLVADGTPASPIVLQPSTTASGSWYGLVIDVDGAGSVIDNLIVRRATYGMTYLATGANTIGNVTSDTASSYGFWIQAGSPTFAGLTAIASGAYGIVLSGATSTTLTGCVVRGSGSRGIDVEVGAGQATTIASCTIDRNGNYGVYTASASGAQISVTSSVVTNQSIYGLYRADSTAWTVSYANVWNNANANYAGAIAQTGAGLLSANPLYVSTTDLRLTSNSPSRFGAANGTSDQGALPYDGVATPGLYGTLWVNTSLAAAGGPYTVGGDLTVAPGVTLTIAAGTTLTFTANTDIMGANANTARAELIVRGKLVALGTMANPIVLQPSTTASGSWYGLVIDTNATGSQIDNLITRRATYGVSYLATGANSLAHVTSDTASSYGFWIQAGTPAFDGFEAIASGAYGVVLSGATSTTLTNCVVRGSGSRGVDVEIGASQSTVLTNCTIDRNGNYGVYTASATGSQITLTNMIVTNQSIYGLYRADSTAWTVSYADVWNNANANYAGAIAQTGNGLQSANPQYVSTTDLHLTSTSIAIDTGTPTTNHDLEGVTRPIDGNGIAGAQYDLGAYEFVLAAMCGNGATEPGEACDSGVHNGMYGYCNATCTMMGPVCGDGHTDVGHEECDDGNASNTDGCLTTCVKATCGDGFIQAGVEACDDGNGIDTDTCTNACKIATCGDGIVEAGVEDCDDGNAVETDACRNTCVAARCGDGVVQAGVEACDDGNVIDTDACRNNCKAAACGDGVIETGVEACDDGNSVDTDACTAACKVATCGDGIVQAGVEMCDDGNAVDTDACRNSCVPAACGDGVVEAGVEACDDGNHVDTDACNNQCVSTSCGDGVVQAGVEACDDGNHVETDGCRNNCVKSYCGDGVVWAGVEECDDGNLVAGDGCSPACTVEDQGGGDNTGSGGGGDDDDGQPSNGGGCCSSSRGGGSILLALVVLASIRRRRNNRPDAMG